MDDEKIDALRSTFERRKDQIVGILTEQSRRGDLDAQVLLVLHRRGGRASMADLKTELMQMTEKSMAECVKSIYGCVASKFLRIDRNSKSEPVVEFLLYE